MIGTSIIKEQRREGVKNNTIFTEGVTDALIFCRSMATEWIKKVKEADRSGYAKSFLVKAIEAYWRKMQGSVRPIPRLFQKTGLPLLDDSMARIGTAIGEAAEQLPDLQAIYELGNVYTALLPESTRSKGGVFYTPPALTNRLLDMTETAGIDWATARVIDPACGGGAFLAPVCARKMPHLRHLSPAEIIEHIESHVMGWEIDPFGAWLSQVFVEIVLRDILAVAEVDMKPLIRVCDSLEERVGDRQEKYDLVIGNPPYGKLKLTDAIRTRYKESLYGHPNLYGLFTHLATDLCAKNGIIALVTPTSFLSGEYFKHLRRLLRSQVEPMEIDFIAVRKGVFEGVLQETMLAAYCKRFSDKSSIKINELATLPAGDVLRVPVGIAQLPEEHTAPWILARSPNQMAPVAAMQWMHSRLKDWGYTVSTGPLVWNRHKTQLKKGAGKSHLPVVWAECIRQDGTFEYRAEKTNHQPFFKCMEGDDWLVVRKPCILLQRTTAKEQEKRLIAAALPSSFLREGVVVENHLNMIVQSNGKPMVAPDVLSVFLNSKAANQAFKAISGSVAISAYELESLPIPDPASLDALTRAVKKGYSNEKIEDICCKLYSFKI